MFVVIVEVGVAAVPAVDPWDDVVVMWGYASGDAFTALTAVSDAWGVVVALRPDSETFGAAELLASLGSAELLASLSAVELLASLGEAELLASDVAAMSEGAG
jgi:hypothetical protein